MKNVGSDAPTLPATIAETPRSSGGVASISADYALGDVIGRGGMADVIAARDQRIGREVAIKRMRGDAANVEAVARFMREARVQARLDHPAIVPVYEFGRDDAGVPYFAMKRLAGETLHDHIAASRPTQPMLRAFAEICLAIELAHTRGVIHRDLKPANVMLGAFGEVYVLDWGLARTLADTDEPIASRNSTPVAGSTVAGSMLGTPGYMSPEQITDATSVGTSSDVYSLGAILFEILAGKPLHPATLEALDTTLANLDRSPAQRAPERAIAPELDALCTRALATDPAQRPTAGELARSVERYLDGDRDTDRRRVMALELVATAHAARAAGDRSTAMRAAGRAIALDPEATEAAELLTGLMIEPQRELPATLAAEMATQEDADVMRHARFGALVYLTIFVLSPLGLWNGIESWPIIVTTVGLSLVLSLIAWSISRRPTRTRFLMYAIGNAAMIGLFVRIFGPFGLAPAFACILMMALLLYPMFARRARVVVPVLLLGWFVPIGLELAGVLSPTWRMRDGALETMSAAIHMGGVSTSVLLFVTGFAMMAVAGFLAGVVARSRLDAQRLLVSQAWHLRQLLPEKRGVEGHPAATEAAAASGSVSSKWVKSR